MSAQYKYDRIPYMVAFAEKSEFKDTYAGPMDFVALEAHLLKPRERPSNTVIVFMHPVGGGAYLPMVSALAKAGHHVIYCNSRYRGADAPLIMEKVAADLGAAIRDAKERWGYETIVLAGWSGGGSLSLWYQSLAARGEGLSGTPAGDPYEVAAEALPPADGLLVLGVVLRLELGAQLLGTDRLARITSAETNDDVAQFADVARKRVAREQLFSLGAQREGLDGIRVLVLELFEQ